MLRNRRKIGLATVKEIDAFPKIPESYVEATTSGGTISVLIVVLISILIVSEIRYYYASKLKFKYGVDIDYDRKLKLNIDVTVAMPCHLIGADILDIARHDREKYGDLNEEPTWFELTPQQQAYWESMNHINNYIRQEFHSLRELLWGHGYSSLYGNMPARDRRPNFEPDACRFYGSLDLNKVSGNLHITAGKAIPLGRGHAHIQALMSAREYNFTHRIERLSFGDSAPGIINPLDAEEKIASQNYLIYQYYIQVVPTEIHTSRFWGSTYQYSVTEQERQIDHEHGSHGIPGIYIKYDMSPIKFEVSEERQSLRMFLVRLCAVVGGVFATSGIITSFVKLVIEWLCCLPIRGKQLSGSNQLNNTLPARPIYEANLPLIETLPDLVTK